MIRTKTFSLLLCLVSLLLVSCNEERDPVGPEVKEGIPVVLKLPYATGNPETVETKGALTDGLVWDLYVLLFDEHGNRLYPEDNKSYYTFSGERSGEISINTTSGKRYIYGVANVDNAIFADLKPKLDNIKNRSDLEKLSLELGNKVVQFSSERYLMSGYFTAGTAVDKEPEAALLCNIVANENGTGSFVGDSGEGLDGSIKLVRLFSVIRFNFSYDGTKVSSFVPTTWDVVNAPSVSSLYKVDPSIDGEYFSDLKLNKFSNPVDSRNNTLEFTMLENIQTVRDGVTIENDNDRENLNKAPGNSTYVVLRGHYIGSGRKYSEGYDGSGNPDENVSDPNANVEADVEYFVHLGRGDIDKADYKSLRNKIYNYNVRITGIDKIITEVVVDDPYHRANGDVTYVEGDVTTVDAHYVTKVLTFDESDLQRGTEFQVKTPFSGGRFLRISDASDAAMPDSWDWVHFMLNDQYDGYSKNYVDEAQRYPDEDNKGKLMDVATFKKYLDNELEENPLSFDDNGQLKVTCFIDEYYYPKKHWSEFVNKDPRVLQIFCRYKEHNNSSLTDAKYVIQQKSIYTFYALDANLPTAWGIEWKNENGPLSENQSGNGNSWSNGRSNMIEDMKDESDWYVDSESSKLNESLMFDYAACMSRNRDENGDGEIDEDEIKWYLPAINQYTDLWLGNEALASGYPLYQNTGEWVHFISNTNRDGQRLILWGEEGSSFGKASADGIGSNEIRCVRNLGMNDSQNSNLASDEPSLFYTYSDNVFRLSKMNDKALRGQFIESGELEAHTHSSLINMPYKAFRVSKNYLSDIEEEYLHDVLVYALPKDYPNKEMPKYEVAGWISWKKPYPKYVEYEGFYYFYDNPGSGWIKDETEGMYITRPMDAKDEYKIIYYRYYKIETSSQINNLGDQILLSKAKELVKKNQSPCKNYSEVIGGRTVTGWRMPNQRELALMVMKKDDLELDGSTEGRGGPYTFSYTEFAYTLGRYFVYGGNLRLTDSGDDPKVYIRCVKDLDE